MTDSFIARGVTPTPWYTEATFYRGVEAVANHTALLSYLTFLTTSLDAVLTSSGNPPQLGQLRSPTRLHPHRLNRPLPLHRHSIPQVPRRG